jgi:hypothetical protein
MIVHLAPDIRSISPSSPARPTAYARLNEYARLLSELSEHYDEDLDRVVVFRYSDELIRTINEHEVYSPDEAWLVFTEKIDELLNELAAVGTR